MCSIYPVRPLVWTQTFLETFQTLGFPILSHMFYRGPFQITDHGHVFVPLFKCLFIHAEDWNHLLLFPTQTPGHRPTHDPPDSVPVHPQQSAGPQDSGALLNYSNNKASKKQGKSGAGFRPGNLYLQDPLVRTFDPGNPSMKINAELAGVHMPPDPCFRMIPTVKNLATFRAFPVHAEIMLKQTIHSLVSLYSNRLEKHTQGFRGPIFIYKVRYRASESPLWGFFISYYHPRQSRKNHYFLPR